MRVAIKSVAEQGEVVFADILISSPVIYNSMYETLVHSILLFLK